MPLFKSFMVFILFFCFACSRKSNEVLTSNDHLMGYKVLPVNIKDVKIVDQFWLPIIKKIQNKTISYALTKCKEEGRMDNFLIAGGKLEGKTRGQMPFDDTDLYKIIEGASNTLLSSPDTELDRLLDTLIDIIAIGQESDGYLTTWRTINPAKPPAPWVKVKDGKRWESLEASHELYNAGHLYEAAATHFLATGKTNFLNIAIKNANLMVATFGNEAGKIQAVPGHQIIETGLLHLYKVTNKAEYIKLAKYFLDSRGNPAHHKLFGEYSQDHLPVVNQDEVVGHAVRAMYMYAAMTDIAALENNLAYHSAVDKLWENMVYKKMYVTGGIGAKHEGESFGKNYELPNLTAYNETCAAIGSVYWNHRLHQLNGDAKYFDIIERTLYNAMLAGLSLDGVNFFYPNPLESDGKYEFNMGACTRKGWFDCSCCPTNMIRFLPSMSNLIYSQTDKDVYVNLFVGSEAKIEFAKKGVLEIKQVTSYPWKGLVNLICKNNSDSAKNLKIRIPSWARGIVMEGDLYKYENKSERVIVIQKNGSPIAVKIVEGYVNIELEAGQESKITIDLPMEAKLISCNALVDENHNKLSLEYGPLIYAFEEIDNKENIDQINLGLGSLWKSEWNGDLLGGVVALHQNNNMAIPYYAWSNRGKGKMKVWVDSKVKN